MIKKMSWLRLSVVLLLAMICAPIDTLAGSHAFDVDENLPYTYEFAQRYVVAGERVLNVTITNNLPQDIEALEFEARLLDPFSDPVSEWNTFSKPDFSIASGHSGTLTLTLSKKNILGINVENILDKARFFELRYTRVLLADGTLLRREDLYPNKQRVYGQYEIELEILNTNPIDDVTKYNFERVSSNSQSEIEKYIESLSYSEKGKYRSVSTLEELMDLFVHRGILLLVHATNITDKPAERNWESSYSPVFKLMDNRKTQYSQYARVYAPQLMSDLSYNGSQLPGVTLTLVYIFDKFDGYNPEELEVYIDGEKYPKTFILGEHGANKPTFRDPIELVKTLLKLAWSGQIEDTLELWHPQVAVNSFAKPYSEGMYQSAQQEEASFLLATLDMVDYVTTPIGFDRFIVSIEMGGVQFHDDVRYMVQKTKDGYVLLLPGKAFDKDGNVNYIKGTAIFNATNRPDPQISYEAAMIANLEGDFTTARKYTSSLISDEYIRETLKVSADIRADLSSVAVLAMANKFREKPDTIEIIDPNLAVLHFINQDTRVALHWEDNMWKMLPLIGLETLYEDHTDGL